MAFIQTNAIVLSSLKFGDTSLIVKCFTQELGLKSYILKGVLQSKKAAIKSGYFQPLHQLNFIANHYPNKNLHTLKEVHVSYHYQNIPFNLIKKTIVLFLSEVLTHSIKEEEENKPLYTFLEQSFIWLDLHDKVANFHLVFLVQLSKYLGFYPDTSQDNLEAFNLLEGVFEYRASSNLSIDGQKLHLFKKFLDVNFDDASKLTFSKTERQLVLDVLLTYFELHLSNFKKPKSIQVFQAVFS